MSRWLQSNCTVCDYAYHGCDHNCFGLLTTSDGNACILEPVGRLLGPNTVINKHSPTTAHRPSSIPLTGSHRSAPGASQQQRQPQHFSNHGSFEQNIPQEQFQASQAVVYGASVVQSQPRYAASGTSNQPQAPDSSFVAAAHVNTCLWPQEPSQHYSRMYYESGISSGVEPSSAVQNADQAAAEPTPPMAAAAAAATGPAVQQPRLQTLVGMPVQLGRIYAQDVIPADSCYILEEQLGHGGFAEVFKASLVSSRSSSSIALGAVPCAAVPAAATASAPQAAAKVFRVSSAGISASQFKKYTGRELTALRALIGCQHHVQLLAEGTVQVAHSSNSRGNPAAATVSHVPASPVAAVADTMTLAPAAGSGVSDGEQRVCAVLELLPHTLDNLLSRYGPMPLPLVKKYLRHLLKGVDVLQSGQLPGGIIIVHRDLKAANLFIAADDTLKIADYSCCAILPGPSTAGDPHQHAADRLHSSIGTCCYMAPEVVYKSRDEGYDASVDVWSVGVVAIEMIAGGWSSMLHAAGVGGQLGSKQHEAAWQQQLTTYVSSGYYRGMLSGMWRMPEMQQVRPFLQCCCGPAAQRWKPAELLTHPWLQDPQQQ